MDSCFSIPQAQAISTSPLLDEVNADFSSGSDGSDMIRYCLFTIIYCLQILQAEGCLGSALKTVTSADSLVSGAAALFQHISAACHTIEATWSLWSGTVQEDGLFFFEDSRQGSDAKHVMFRC